MTLLRLSFAIVAIHTSMLSPVAASGVLDPDPRASPQSRDRNAKLAEFIRPFPGSLVLCGLGDVPDHVFQSFVQLAGDETAALIVIGEEAKSAAVMQLTQLRGDRIQWIDCSSDNWHRRDRAAMDKQFEAASGIWIDLAEEAQLDRLPPELIRGLFEQKKTLGAAGRVAQYLVSPGYCESEPPSDEAAELSLIPKCKLHLAAGQSDLPDFLEAGWLHWFVPRETALVLHSGRTASAHGRDPVWMVGVPDRGEAPFREKVNLTVFSFGDLLEGLDLIVQLRLLHPAVLESDQGTKPRVPKVQRGTLFLHGGGGVDDETFLAFIEAAGGKDASFVCVPTADDEPDSYSERRLKELGCKNVAILNTRDPKAANEEKQLLQLLDDADAVWVDGGRTYRVMDAYENTKVHEKLFALLKRGGAYGGSSAGCQVASELLVRGNPVTADQPEFPAYIRGLGLLPGVVLDAHFRQRFREYEFGYLVLKHPNLLGIGVDENTAIIVEGSVARVVGENAVTFFDALQPASTGRQTALPKQTVLRAGESFDLEKRVPMEAHNRKDPTKAR